MNTIPIFQTNFFTFLCEDQLTDRILELAKNKSYVSNNSNKITDDDYFFDKELFNWFDDCLEKAKIKLGFPEHITLPITTCWTNKTTKLMGHHKHRHPNSFISGIFYLTTHDSSPTIFYQNNFWISEINNQFKIDKNTFREHIDTGKIYPKKSMLILFPSNTVHSVNGLPKNEERFTVSFNTYISGVIDGSPDKCRLELIPKSVRDYHENLEQTS
jgi:uncharacterized protein (TIGR02466 family)